MKANTVKQDVSLKKDKDPGMKVAVSVASKQKIAGVPNDANGAPPPRALNAGAANAGAANAGAANGRRQCGRRGR
ncbi:hypothetical protein MTO96_052057 [Rhipicephalus appendiculatus]